VAVLHHCRAHLAAQVAEVPAELVEQERQAVGDRGVLEAAVDVLGASLRSVAAACSMIARSKRSWVQRSRS
jgi:hypothetical protein